MDKAKLVLETQCELDHLRIVALQAGRLLAVKPADRREWDAIAGGPWGQVICILAR